VIATERLELLPATPELARAALAGPVALAQGLGAAVPESWPPEFLDDSALQYTYDRLVEGPGQADWWLYFILLIGTEDGRTLIGSAGYKGPPSADGTVEVGYGIVHDRQRQGFASEAVRGLLTHAFSRTEVVRVIAETLPELTGSIGVLEKCGFRRIGEGSEPGVIRFELLRADHAADRVAPRPELP
jgi:RimJ/RimL family protein N-acetyltransferase